MTLGELITLCGYLTGGAVFIWQAKRKRLATDGVMGVAATGLVCGLLGAAVAQVLAGGTPGRSIVGGLIGGWLGVELAKRRYGLRRSTGDLFALALPAGEAVGRIGCFFNGCCMGSESSVPWSVWQHGALRHPSQLYSAAWAAATFAALWWMSRRDWTEGTLFRAFLALFGAGRFVVEFWRVNPPVFGSLTAAQWFGLELIGMSLAMEWLASRRSRSFRPAGALRK